jgi:PAS domain S-box-containing protein
MEDSKINKIWSNLITSGKSDLDKQNVYRMDQNFQELRRIIFLNSLTLLTALLTVCLTLISYYAGDLTQAAIRFVIFFGCLISFGLLRLFNTTRIPSIFIHVVFTFVFLALAITDTFTLTTFIGFFSFSYLSFFVWDRKLAGAWNIGMMVAFIFIFNTKGINFNFESDLRVLMESIVFFLFMFGVNYILRLLEDRNEELLIKSRMELGRSFMTLTEEVERSKRLESNLKTSLDSSSDSNKKLEKTQKAMLNILEDLENEKAQIQKRQANDEAILGSVGEGLVVVDKNQVITLVNEAFENILGLKAKDVIGKPFTEAIITFNDNQEPLELEDTALYKALNEGESSYNIIRYFKKAEGTLIPVGLNVSPIDLDGEVIGAVEVFRDITKEREVDKAKTEFVSLASHQLKTPLAAINWYSEILLSGDGGELNENQKDYIKEIYNGGKRMTELVTSLLNVSRIDLGTFAVEPELVDIREITDSVIGEMKPQVVTKKLQIEKEYGKSIPKIMLDPKLIRIVLQNLISNSVKYTPENGKVFVSIDCDSLNLEVIVKDTGYGIPKSQQEKIFTKLFRADNVISKETDGTGLGLYIVKSIVEQANGKIWFESEENKGTSFFIEIPLTGMEKRVGTRQLS